MAHATTDLEELWRRVAFPILINNGDDHLHNHGFLHVEGVLQRARELKTWISEDVRPARGGTASHDRVKRCTITPSAKPFSDRHQLGHVDMTHGP